MVKKFRKMEMKRRRFSNNRKQTGYFDTSRTSNKVV